MFGAKLLLVSL